MSANSNHVGNIHGHLLNLCVIVLLDVLHGPHVIIGHKVDRHTFTTKTTAPPNPIQVVPHVLRQIEI